MSASITLMPNQSCVLSAIPMFQGVPGARFPEPVTWDHNGGEIGINLNLTPNGETCTVALGWPTEFGSCSVYARSGSLSDVCIVVAERPIADTISVTAMC